MISIQSLRKKEREEQESRRQREIALRNPVRGFNFGGQSIQPMENSVVAKQGVLKFARFLYDS